MDNLLAVATYGSQRVKHPVSGQTVSAYKLGYTGAGRAVLLALLRTHAQDVTSRQASYHYVHISGEVTVWHGYILLKVSDDELTKAESLTIQTYRPAVYRWLDGAWHELPNAQSPDYQPLTGRSGPGFNPAGMRVTSPGGGDPQAAVAGIVTETVRRSASDTPWHWIRGDTYPHRDLLRRWGCRWSKRHKAWYYIGTTLPDAVQQLIAEANTPSDAPVSDAPCSVEEAAAILGVTIRETPPPTADSVAFTAPDQPETSDEPRIRVIRPQPVADAAASDPVQAAIQQVRADPPKHVARSSSGGQGRRALVAIPHEPVGELTGSITGNVWCYGYAIHQGICVYLNMGGPRMAVEAIRAKLAKGDSVNCVPWDAPSVELTAGEGNTGMYTAFTQNIPEAKFTSLILLHEMVTQPNYGGKATTFIFHVGDEQAMGHLQHHVTTLVNVPVFADWTGYLWQAGQSAMLVRKTRGAGGLDVLAVDLDADSWTRLLTGGLSQGVIRLPPSG